MNTMYQHILVGVDGSKHSEHALKRAIAFAKSYKASLYIAHIIDTRALNNYATLNYNYDSLINEETVKALEEYKHMALDQGLTQVETIIEYGSPRTLMSRTLAEEYDIDLICVGATGLNAVERMFIGSVSEQITRQAPCDVLVVRMDEDEEEAIEQSDYS